MYSIVVNNKNTVNHVNNSGTLIIEIVTKREYALYDNYAIMSLGLDENIILFLKHPDICIIKELLNM